MLRTQRGKCWLWPAAKSILLIGLILASGCDKIKKFLPHQESGRTVSASYGSQELLYQTESAELRLSESSKPYLAFDIPGNSLELRLKGVVVMRTPIEIVEVEKSALGKFVERFAAGKGLLVRPLAGKYLFAGHEQTPDSILAIVGPLVNVKPESLQREIPSRFRLFWDEKLILDVVSDPPDTKKHESVHTRIEHTMMEARYVLRRPFGATLLVIHVNPEEAMTLYRVADAGLPTLIDLVPSAPPPPSKPPTIKKK